MEIWERVGGCELWLTLCREFWFGDLVASGVTLNIPPGATLEEVEKALENSRDLQRVLERGEARNGDGSEE